MSRIQFSEVSRLSPEFGKLQLFAESFNHTIAPMASGRVFEIHRKDRTLGYADIVYLPIAFPAWHPELTRPRDVIETMEGYKHHCALSSGGEGFMGVPLDSMRTTFPASMLEKQGFTRMQRELYVLNGAR